MKIKLLFSCILLMAACSANPPVSNSTDNQTNQNAAGQKAPASIENKKENPEKARENSNTTAKSGAVKCPDVSRKGKLQVKSQTFPFNLKPFTDSCFVTFADTGQMVDKTDVPRGSTFHIYKGSESVLDLPDAFDGQEACWVEGVSFKDLNEDGFTDIIIAGSCLAAKDSYPSNAIFVNNGKDFTTDATANENIQDLRKLSAIEAFVKKNQKMFF